MAENEISLDSTAPANSGNAPASKGAPHPAVESLQKELNAAIDRRKRAYAAIHQATADERTAQNARNAAQTEATAAEKAVEILESRIQRLN